MGWSRPQRASKAAIWAWVILGFCSNFWVGPPGARWRMANVTREMPNRTGMARRHRRIAYLITLRIPPWRHTSRIEGRDLRAGHARRSRRACQGRDPTGQVDRPGRAVRLLLEPPVADVPVAGFRGRVADEVLDLVVGDPTRPCAGRAGARTCSGPKRRCPGPCPWRALMVGQVHAALDRVVGGVEGGDVDPRLVGAVVLAEVGVLVGARRRSSRRAGRAARCRRCSATS